MYLQKDSTWNETTNKFGWSNDTKPRCKTKESPTILPPSAHHVILA